MNFIKKIIQATGELDTLMYLNSDSFEDAIALWVKDLAAEIKSLMDVFREHRVTASRIIDLNATILEKKNRDYLDYLIAFQEKIEYILARKAIQYVSICKKFDSNKKKSKKFKTEIIKQEGIPYLEQLDISLSLIRKFADQHLREVAKRKLTSLTKYEPLYDRLRIFSKLDRTSFLRNLLEKGEI